MDSAYQLFRIIFSLIVASFLFLMLFHYASQYRSMGELHSLVNTYNKLRWSIDYVVQSGNPFSLKESTDLKNFDCVYEFEQTSGLYLKCNEGNSFLIPTLLISDFSGPLTLERRRADTKFINNYYVLGYSYQTYVINIQTPDKKDPRVLHLLDIMPSENTYLLCSPQSSCKQNLCKKEDLIYDINYNLPDTASFSCSFETNLQKANIIKFTETSCSGNDYNLCIKFTTTNTFPAEATVYDSKEKYQFIIKSDTDYLLLLSTLTDKTKIKTYLTDLDYFTKINKKILWDTDKILRLYKKRSELMKKSSSTECEAKWDNFINEIENFQIFVNNNLYNSDYNNINYANEYINAINDINQKYEELIESNSFTSNGCDYENEEQTEY